MTELKSTVVVIDDDPSVRESLANLLRSIGRNHARPFFRFGMATMRPFGRSRRRRGSPEPDSRPQWPKCLRSTNAAVSLCSLRLCTAN